MRFSAAAMSVPLVAAERVLERLEEVGLVGPAPAREVLARGPGQAEALTWHAAVALGAAEAEQLLKAFFASRRG